MPIDAQSVRELDHDDLIWFVLETFHRNLIHYGLWFREVEHQNGLQEALAADAAVFRTGMAYEMKRLGKILGFEVDKDGVPMRLRQMSQDELMELATGSAANWLVTDGVWFQQVERDHGMDYAKRSNDLCWARLSPHEAFNIKRFLGMGKHPGLEGLKRALNFRNYSLLNKQSIHEVDENGFIFQMNDCRVQSARKRQGLADYPCHSVGNVEYPSFASSIDERIVTQCVGCPPDHPDEWYCAWKFTLEE
ncbi:MAG: DUF6125 family protein [Desulfarculaceae bacterium]|nr:DUF6125 family protein [Desulfarculaceae bacterium]MCF8070807.1 DUF6125 family protein [Desulfarculaceae bacterium]MCF8102244.1 DUF6125 family protein [Desulfarculaceae bacterium]MCF8117694.1 DUF6125 family protein [Desulfarculaceae bacterium]